MPNLVSSTYIVPEELDISQSSIVYHLHNLSSISSCSILLHVIKILLNFWLMHICTYTYVYVCVYMYIFMCVRTHTHTHTHTYTQNISWEGLGTHESLWTTPDYFNFLCKRIMCKNTYKEFSSYFFSFSHGNILFKLLFLVDKHVWENCKVFQNLFHMWTEMLTISYFYIFLTG